MEENKPFEIKAEVAKAVADFRKKQIQKSFSGRHPELGKMIKCAICRLRHRSSQICVQTFVKDAKGEAWVSSFSRQSAFKGRRIHQHWSQKRMQIVQLTKELLPRYETVNQARTKARNMLRKIWHDASNRVQAQQKLSRRINWGLV